MYSATMAADTVRFLHEVRTLLKRYGRLLIVEPKRYVSRADFVAIQAAAEAVGLAVSAPAEHLMRHRLLMALP